MIFNELTVVWKINPRLKSSVKYKKVFMTLTIEIPKIIGDQSAEKKDIIFKYIQLKRKKKAIPNQLKREFSDLFPTKKQKAHILDIKLLESVKSINANYFDNTCNISVIYWTPHPSKRTLGRYFDSDQSISISSYLNSKDVPEIVINYIIYHEMCHQVFSPYILDGKRKVHHKEFKKAERKFKGFLEAKKWIRNNIK